MFKLKSHPSPEDTLFRHLSNVGFSCKEILSYYKHYQLSKLKCDDIIFIAYIIGVTHDFAKATSFFQNMLLKKGKRSIYSTHSALSSLFTYFVCSKIFPYNIELQCLSYVVVKRHHGNLRNILDVEADEDGFNIDVISKQIQNIITKDYEGFKSIDELKEIYKILLPSINLDDFFSINLIDLFKDIRRNLKRIVISESIDNYFVLIALYSALQTADKTDAGKLPNPPRLCNLDLEMVYKYRESNFFPLSDKISYLRNDAFNNIIENVSHLDVVNDKIFSITLPTGFGKTIMGLTSALLIRKNVQNILGYQPRIIYSLPFLSIIDQNAQVFKKILSYNYKDIDDIPSNMLIIHHHLSDFTYRFNKKNDDWSERLDSNDEFEAITYRSSLFLTEGWNAEIIITTFVQLFESLITNRKNMLRKFNNISGSIIILDEIQAIPPKYWDVIENSLNYICKEFGCWIIFMTATKPALLDFSKELSTNNYQYEERVKYKIIKENSINSLSDFVLSLLQKKNSILVVLNTIGSSRELYDIIKTKLNLLYNDEPTVNEDGICIFRGVRLVYLSSYVLPHTRLKRIADIKKNNNNNKQNETVKTIVISTQIVEAGVDIDMDCVIRDFAPLDSIIQCAGRCNRNAQNKNLGEVIIIELMDELNNNRLFCSYIYDNVLLSITRNLLMRYPENIVINEKDIISQIDVYFKKVKDSKESEPVIEDMKNLHFDKVKEFELIETYDSIQVFVEFDNQAKEIREKIANNELPDKIKFLPDIKRLFNSYTLNIKKPKEIEVAGMLPLIEGTEIRYIPFESKQIWYNLETGIDLKLDRTIEMQII